MQFSAPDNYIGKGQSWQDVSASRAAGVTYTNSTGKSIVLNVGKTGASSAQLLIYVDGNLAGKNIDGGNWNMTTVCAIVPPGSTYSVTVVSTTISYWTELR